MNFLLKQMESAINTLKSENEILNSDFQKRKQQLEHESAQLNQAVEANKAYLYI
jgi:hypothetical protein